MPDLNSDTQIEIEVDWEAAKRTEKGRQLIKAISVITEQIKEKENLLVFLNAAEKAYLTKILDEIIKEKTGNLF